MIRYLALVLALASPLDANAFEDQIRYLNGLTITATRSASRLCGVDFLIAVSDGDQHLVKIDYSYEGVFKDNSVAQDVPMNWIRGTRSDKLNVSVGRNTMSGALARVAAPEFPYGSLVCGQDWRFHFIPSEYNASQQQRNDADELKRKEQARLDEIKRKRAEEAERRRKAAQFEIDRLKAHAKAARDQVDAYRRASPENSRCIVNNAADMARCEQWKAREREQRLKLEAEAIEAQKRVDAASAAAARQEAQFRESDALYERQMADPCAVAADQAQRMPQILAQLAAPTPQNMQAKAQWQQSQAGLDATCAATKPQAQNVLPQSVLPQSAPAQPEPQPQPTSEQQTPEQQQIQLLLDVMKKLGVFK